jgi:hypothetical protein
MWIATARHTEMAWQLAVLRAVVSSTMQSEPRCSLTKTFQMCVMEEMLAEFQEQVERCLRLEGFGMRICDLILGPPFGWVQLVDHLEEAIGRLQMEPAGHREANAELEALWNSTSRVRGLVLGRSIRMSSLSMTVSSAMELIEGHIDIVADNGVWWQTRSTLATTLSHFLELQTELELPRSGHNVNLMERQVDALWT